MKYIISAACLLLAIVTAVTAQPTPPPYAPDAGVIRTVCDTPAEPIPPLPTDTTPPVQPPVIQAHKENDATTYTNRPFDPAEWDYVTVTAYCACAECCGEWAYKRPIAEDGTVLVLGAKGDELIEGVSVAAKDLEKYPIGTVLEIYGVGTMVVHDCGSEFGDIDVYFADHDEARVFGIKTAWVQAAEQ